MDTRKLSIDEARAKWRELTDTNAPLLKWDLDDVLGAPEEPHFENRAQDQQRIATGFVA